MREKVKTVNFPLLNSQFEDKSSASAAPPSRGEGTTAAERSLPTSDNQREPDP